MKKIDSGITNPDDDAINPNIPMPRLQNLRDRKGPSAENQTPGSYRANSNNPDEGRIRQGRQVQVAISYRYTVPRKKLITRFATSGRKQSCQPSRVRIS